MNLSNCLGVVGVAVSIGLASAYGWSWTAAAQESPKVRVVAVDGSAPTVLMAVSAVLMPAVKGGLTERWPQAAKKFWVENWTSEDEAFTWTVQAPKAGSYAVSLIVVNCGAMVIDCKEVAPAPVDIEIASERNTVDAVVKYHKTAPSLQWMREEAGGTLRLPAGTSKVTVRARSTRAGGPFHLALFSVELQAPAAKRAMEARAAKERSSTAWMADSKYGLMITWSAASQPRHGAKKPYAEAVQDFDVKAFADWIAGTGAGFVEFSTSWADYYFPGPIKAIDAILPGRTTKRDLISDLADALNARGVKLILYYHAGHGDADWWSKTGFLDADKTAYFQRWEGIMQEIGLRYGSKLAGYWFDDATAVYYPLQAPWEKMTAAAKAGNSSRVICYNSWIWPKATDFQDYFCGEGELTPEAIDGDGFLPVGGSGRFTGGPEAGLQATITTTNEGFDWGHIAAETAIPAPRLSTAKMIELMQEAAARRVVPVLNLEVYQDGSPSPEAMEEFKAIRQALKEKQ